MAINSLFNLFCVEKRTFKQINQVAMVSIEALFAFFSIEIGFLAGIFFRIGAFKISIDNLKKDVERIEYALNLTPNIKK